MSSPNPKPHDTAAHFPREEVNAERALGLVRHALERLDEVSEDSSASIPDFLSWHEIDNSSLGVPSDAHFDVGRAVGTIEAIAFLTRATPEEVVGRCTTINGTHPARVPMATLMDIRRHAAISEELFVGPQSVSPITHVAVSRAGTDSHWRQWDGDSEGLERDEVTALHLLHEDGSVSLMGYMNSLTAKAQFNEMISTTMTEAARAELWEDHQTRAHGPRRDGHPQASDEGQTWDCSTRWIATGVVR